MYRRPFFPAARGPEGLSIAALERATDEAKEKLGYREVTGQPASPR
jgi:hypothetical protein